MLRSVFIVTLLAAATPVASSQMPPIGIIDVYGIRTVREEHVRGLLRIAVGDSFPSSVAAAELRLGVIPGVVRARISGTCCEAGKSVLFVGIEETASAAPRFRPEPDGFIYLPQDVLQTGAALDAAREAAVLRGQAGEDQSAGHSLMQDSAGRALQLRFIRFAVRDAARLRDVLLYSNDASQRARAAEVIAYGPDKGAAIRDLVGAVTDASSQVRNNAVRALGLLALYARQHPELRLSVPAAPFVDMLNSPVWTDRNKSTLALMQITESRDSTLLRELKARALPALVEMARWKSQGHAFPSFMILGRIAGLPDDAIFAAWSKGDRQVVIDAATRAR